MSASLNDDGRRSDLNQSLNYDEIEELISNENETREINTESRITINSNEILVSQQSRSSCITQVQKMSLSLEKSLANIEENSENDSSNKSKLSILNVKTSNIPGPVGLLPILVS